MTLQLVDIGRIIEMTFTLVGKSSPWGTVQDEEQVAEGIIYVSTASHGHLVEEAA